MCLLVALISAYNINCFWHAEIEAAFDNHTRKTKELELSLDKWKVHCIYIHTYHLDCSHAQVVFIVSSPPPPPPSDHREGASRGH